MSETLFSRMLSLVLAVCVVISVAIAIDIKPIVGGNDANNTQFPYQISVRNPKTNFHICGGSIISPQWVLSAAHCFPSSTPASSISIVVGTIYIKSGGISYNVSKIVTHSGYNSTTLENDIAVLKVDGNITLNSTINVQSIRLGCAAVPVNSSLIVSGWGLTKYNPNVTPNILQYLRVISISVLQCRDNITEYSVFDTNQCTTTPRGQGACHGDSGGPLVYSSQQVGIVSWGFSCALGRPDVYTSVPAFRDWIRNNTGV